MDEEWRSSYMINPMIQESMVLSNSIKISDSYQQELLYETNQTSSSGTCTAHSHGQFKENDLVRLPTSKSKMSTHSARNDQQYLCSSSTSESGASNHQSCLRKSVQRQTILKSPKTTVAKRKTQTTKKSERDNKKKPRNETNSSFSLSNYNKAGKEKMGDRIAALQRLVSPFGKADTASVLSECIEYIRFLHEQVLVLSSTPYSTTTGAEAQDFQNLDDCFYDRRVLLSGSETGLSSRGLRIVPVSSALWLTPDPQLTNGDQDSGSHNLQV